MTLSARARPPVSNGDYAADFEQLRNRLFGVAYQILGRAPEAEDVVQDVWLRWQLADRALVRDRLAFLVTITTRLALNSVTSARARREITTGESPPERPVEAVDPALTVEREEALQIAVQRLLERLSPLECAVYLLREGFDFSFREIGDDFAVSEVTARQVARRARLHLADDRRYAVDRLQLAELSAAVLDASRGGGMKRLLAVLAEATTVGLRAPCGRADRSRRGCGGLAPLRQPPPGAPPVGRGGGPPPACLPMHSRRPNPPATGRCR